MGIKNMVLARLESERHRKSKMDNTVKQIQKAVRRKYPHACVYPFGSCVTGLGLQGSDLDVACDLEGKGKSISREEQVKFVQVLAEHLKGRFDKVSAVPRARVPIVSLCIDGLECDLTLDASGGQKTRLLHAYLHASPELRVIAIGLRLWGKAVGIVDPQHGGLSAFHLDMMMLHALLQCDRSQTSVNPEQFKAHELPPTTDLPPAADADSTQIDRLWEMIFAFYNAKFDWRADVVSFTRDTSTQDGPSDEGFGLKDPLSQELRTAHNWEEVRDAFRKAYADMQAGRFSLGAGGGVSTQGHTQQKSKPGGKGKGKGKVAATGGATTGNVRKACTVFSIQVECAATGRGHLDRCPVKVVVVNSALDVLVDERITPEKPVHNWLTTLTGCTASDKSLSLRKAVDLVRKHVPKGSTIVAQAPDMSLKWLQINSKDYKLVSLSEHFCFRKTRTAMFSLALEVHVLLGRSLRPHNTITNGLESIRLYAKYPKPGGDAAQKLFNSPGLPSVASEMNFQYGDVCLSAFNAHRCQCGQQSLGKAPKKKKKKNAPRPTYRRRDSSDDFDNYVSRQDEWEMQGNSGPVMDGWDGCWNSD
eukprot:TRINITY_DN168_c0_g1_i2.p1 TRINITY_DN168_c0_g1~~TRINITY_DN168_c0_g1_i2.p1  ORF type:complete len:601 (+),score=128.89 TRINITY_DN168_c0_g1_i2:37-1803(+)